MEETKWAVYEANVQSYRSNFFASQSIMIAVGAMILEKNYILVIVVTSIALFQMWYVWFRVILSRCIICDYYKFSMYEKFDKQGYVRGKNTDSNLSEHDYVSLKEVRKRVNKNMSEYYDTTAKFRNIRITRMKIDIILPVTMTVIWCAFVVYSIIVSFP